jgi:FkbM family methyltransferase
MPNALDTWLLPEPLVICDIGARGGADDRWRRFRPYVRIVGFEADVEECERLARLDDGVRYLPYAIGEHDDERTTFYVTRNPQCSSFLRPNHAFTRSFAFGAALDVVGEVPMTLTSLRTACAREGIEPDLLKLDVQGLELAVLRGAGDTLDRVLVVDSEVEFNQQYEGQPLYGDVDAHLQRHGFYVVGLRRTYWRRQHQALGSTVSSGGTLMHGDAVWARKAESLTNLRDLLGLCLLMAAYEEADTICWILLGQHPLLADWTTDQRLAVVHQLLPTARGKWSWLFGHWHHRQMRQWVDRQRPRGATDWHDPQLF